jgi:DcaP outer membrane protein
MKDAAIRVIILVLCFGGTSAIAQTSDMDQMKAKMAQLEQMMKDLRSQMAAVEKGQPSSVSKSAAVLASPAQDQPDKTPAGATAEQVNSEASPDPLATERVTESRMDVYGAAMFDSGYNGKASDPDWFDVLRVTKLPAYPGQYGVGGNWFNSVRQSRLGVKTNTETRWGQLKTIFEFELFGTGVDAGQTTFRLRHAFGELGQVGAGQTWSTFMDPDVFPNSVEYWGPPGMVFYRNVQLRWTPWRSGDSNFMVAIERPGGSGDGGVYSNFFELANIQPKFPAPDFTGHYRLSGKRGHFQVAGIVRDIQWKDLSTNSPYNLSGSAVGWGVNLSGSVKLSKHVARLQTVYGSGIENYMNDSTFDIGPQNNFSNTTKPIFGKALPVLGIVAFMDFNWNKHFTTSAGYSLEQITNSTGSNPTDFHRGQYALVNILYYPVKDMFLGPELQWGKRTDWHENFDADDWRIQFSVKFNFKYQLGGAEK